MDSTDYASNHLRSLSLGRQLLIVGIVACVTFLTALGTPGLWDEDEGFFAAAALEMHHRNEWIVPYFNGELFSHKPPFMFWMMRLGFFLFGENEWGARILSAVFGTATALLTTWLGRRLFGELAGLWAGLAMASCVMFGVVSRAATPDSFLVFMTLLTISLYVRGTPTVCDGRRDVSTADLLPARWRTFAGIYAVMGLAVLVKGPIGVLLPGTAVGLFVILASTRNIGDGWRSTLAGWGRQLFSTVPFRVFRQMRPLTAIGIVLLVAGPWYVAVGLLTEGRFLLEFFGVHNFGRFLEPMERHSGPIIYYFPAALVGFFPWSTFWLPAFLHALSVTCRRNEQRDMARPWLLLLCWGGVVVGFFSLAGTKLPSYILPAYPAFALVTAGWIEKWRTDPRSVWSGWPRLSYGSLIVVGLGISASFPILTTGSWQGRSLLDIVSVHPDLAGEGLPIAGLGMILILGGSICYWLVARGRPVRSLAAFGTTTLLFCTALLAFEAMRIDRYQFNREAIRELAAHAPPGVAGTTLFVFRCFEPTLAFYGGNNVRELETVEELRAFHRERPGMPILFEDRHLPFVERELGLAPRIVKSIPDFPKPGMLHVVIIPTERDAEPRHAIQDSAGADDPPGTLR